jgi:sensor histidine kinase regulating citrate/malate metabolism
MIVSGETTIRPLLSPVKVEFIVVTRVRSRATLAGQLLVLQVAVILAVLVVVAGLSIAQSEATFTRVEGRRVSAVAEQLGGNPLVRSSLSVPEVRTGLATFGQTALIQYRVTSVSFADIDETVRTSTDPGLDNTRIPLPRKAVADGASWSGTLDLAGQHQLVSQVPVFSAEAGLVGEHLGTVMVTEAYPSVWQRLRNASSYLLIYLGTALLIGLFGSWLLARRIKRQTLGLEPREIAGLAEHREAMLYGIAEGVVALDPDQRVTLANDVARRLLDLPEHSVGLRLSDLRIGGRLRDVLSGVPDHGGPGAEEDARDQVVIRRGRVLVMNRMRVTKDGRDLGSVTTLRDRTELANLEREIGSFRSTTQLLRAQTHEFANQLHTIRGLIQIGDYDGVVAFVDAVSERRHSLDLSVNSRVRDPAVGALLMAKASLAAERRVELRIDEDTSLERLQPEDSADLATVVGNLVDNAIDAATAPADGAGQPWVAVRIRQDASSVEVVVRDSGPGVGPDLAREVFEHGFTTKAAESGEHGIGLALTRLMCQRRGGEVRLDNTGDGAMFTATLNVAPVAEAVR